MLQRTCVFLLLFSSSLASAETGEAIVADYGASSAADRKIGLAKYLALQKQWPQDPEVHHLAALAYARVGLLKKAATSLRAALALDDSSELWQALAMIEERAGHIDEATAAMRAATERSDSPSLWFSRIRFLRRSQQPQHLAAAFSEMERAFAARPDIIFALALYYDEHGFAASAERLFKKATRLRPTHVPYLLAYAYSLAQRGHLLAALGPLATAEKIDGENATIFFDRGVVYLRLGEAERARVALSQAVALDSAMAAAHNNLALAYQKLGRLDDAVSSCSTAIAIAPKSAEAHYNLGVLFFHQRLWGEAEAELAAAEKLEGETKAIAFLRGEMAFQRGDEEAALAAFKRAASLPEHQAATRGGDDEERSRLLPTAEEEIALATKERDDGAAARHYRRAIELDDRAAAAYYALGKIAQKRGDLDAALMNLGGALLRAPDLAAAHFARGQIWRQQGKERLARRAFARAVSAKADYQEAKKALENLEGAK